jgi:hypothetical protein
MNLFFNDGTSINVTLYNNTLTNYILRCFKHLQHVDIPFNKRDTPEFLLTTSVPDQVEDLVGYANELDIIVDQQKCLSLDQTYLNFLHQVYEKNYNGNPIWMDFHETIHILEKFSRDPDEIPRGSLSLRELGIYYREAMGLLEQKFDESYQTDFVTQTKPGELYIAWAELGKTPFSYWQDKEPTNINRICELAVPWDKLKPYFFVSIDDQDLLVDYTKKVNEFLAWWAPYKEDWCTHWNLNNWKWQDMFSVIPIGKVENFNGLVNAIDRGAVPKRVFLDSKHQNKETLSVDLYITATWNSHPPALEILIDNNSVLVPSLTKGTNHIKFDITLEFGKHKLKIIRSGATSHDNSQLVKIESIFIDEFDCERCVLNNSAFKPIYPEPWASQQRKQNVELLEIIPYETVLGHNGEWDLPFASPFYPHLLEINASKFTK